MPTILENVWKLRTDPFYPDKDCSGRPIAADALDKTLDPLVDERVIPYYFDVYDWTASALVGDLSPEEGLLTFPTPRTLPGEGLLVLISGDRESGLDSLANLVLHKIKHTHGGQPGKPLLIVDVELESRDPVRNVAAVASHLINAVRYCETVPNRQAIADEMRGEYTRVTGEQAGRKDASYSELFRAFRNLLKPVDHTLVIKIIKGGDYDSWVRIHESAKSCCSYVIVTTASVPQAKTCYDAMTGRNLNVAWIQAKPLGHSKAQEFVANRIAAHRTGAIPNSVGKLFPFTAEALAALYEPGVGATPGKPIDYPIGWLRRTLYAALAEHLKTMNLTYGAASDEALAAIDVAKTALGPAEVIRTRNKLNRGG
jgi:hypothetical protein